MVFYIKQQRKTSTVVYSAINIYSKIKFAF